MSDYLEYFAKTRIRTILAASLRYLKISFKYKLEFIFNTLWTVMNVAAFALLGFFVSAQAGLLPPGEAFYQFLLIGVFFWSIWGAQISETVSVIQEEATRGTLGLMISYNMSISEIFLSRMIASTIRTTLIAMILIYPVLYVLNIGLPLVYFPIAIFVFFMTSFFIFGLSQLIGSLTLVWKRLGVLPGIFEVALKMVTGMYFPTKTFGSLAGYVSSVPLATGLDLMRDLMILKTPYPAVGNSVYSGSLTTLSLSMIIGSLIIFAISIIVLKKCEFISRKNGTIDQY